ncbi:MAG TPA: hypothetical protein PLM81_12245 [Ginsengibacter sp.]|nr:hypothetical protein [Ginsengibacter sp.]HRP43764.1 hypothetical protein [Ginsengibacter sp.]
MKKLFIIFLVFLPLSILLFSSCKKDKNTDCGCDSNVVKLIPDSSGLLGTISYKTQIDPNDNFYNNRYWLGYKDSAFCSICSVSFVLCNEDILPLELKSLKTLPRGSYYTVKFSGNVKELCTKKFDIPERNFYHITLTKIEKQ